MKFQGSVTIEKPFEEVTALYMNPANLKEWQDGFINKELLRGEEGAVGTVSKIYFQQGKRAMELTETILENNLPHSFEAFYHHTHMDNTLVTTFEAKGKHQTLYTTKGEYTAFRGFIPKMLALLFPGMFRKQAYKWMVNFKNFAEKQ
jgi:hypothetical protein